MQARFRHYLLAHLRPVCVALLFLFAGAGPAYGAGPIIYHYDALGRLVSVTDTDGNTAIYTYDAVGNIVKIARLSAAEAGIADFAPGAGPEGTIVTISGSGFSTTAAQNAVTFNEASAAVVSATSTQLIVRVPAGATTGLIKVATPTASAVSARAFVVQASLVPTITSFTPTIGAPGTAITISGSNFDPLRSANKVALNGRAAVTISASPTGIGTTVPQQAASGRISVETVYGTGNSSTDFFVPPSPYTAADIEVLDRMSIGQSKTVVIANAGKKAMILFDGAAGQRISAQLKAVTINSGSVSILRPDGSALGDSAGLTTSGSFIDALSLPLTGTYTIFVNPGSSSKGTLTVGLAAIQDVTASIAIDGPAQTVATTVAGQNAYLKFSGTAGQRLTLSVTGASSTGSCPRVLFLKPDGTNLVSSLTACSSAYVDVTTLPDTGTYTLVFDPYSSTTATATFLVRSVPPDLNGNLAIDGPPATLTTAAPGQNARLTFDGTAGQRITLSVSDATSTGSCPKIFLLKPDGTNLVPSFSACSSAYVDVTTLPATGTYTVVFDPYSSSTGSATFQVRSVPADLNGTMAIDGPPATLTTAAPGQNARLTFAGTAGQRITLSVSDATSTGSCPKIFFLKPDGTNLVSSFSACSSAYVDVTTLPATGTYTVVFDPYSSSTASATFQVRAVPADLSGTMAIDGPPATLTTAAPGQNARLTFDSTAGQRITLSVSDATSTGSCPKVFFLKPDGANLVSSFSACSSAYVDVTTLPATGTYSLVFDPYSSSTASATFQVRSVPPDVAGTLVIDGPGVTLATTAPGQNARLTFDGAAGQRVRLKVTLIASSLSCPYFSILKPDQSTLGSRSSGCSSYSIDSPQLPVSGTYTVLMDPSNNRTGSATFALGSAVAAAQDSRQ
jgi:YD repeat-containing protein